MDDWDAYDFTWEEVCYRAFGGRWIGPLPDAIRPDKAEGHGPLPTLELWSEVFDRYSKILNLLDTVRVSLPYKLEQQRRQYLGAVSIDGAAGDDCAQSNTACGTNGRIAWWGTGPPALTLNEDEEWAEVAGSITAFTSVEFGPTCAADPSKWSLGSMRWTAQYRVALVAPDAVYAVPELWRDMISSDGAVLGTLDIQSWSYLSSPGTPTPCFGPGGYGGCHLEAHYYEDSHTCVMTTAGILEPGQPRPSWHTICKEPGWGGTTGYSRVMSYTPLATRSWYLRVPIVDVT
jgi:hypothetical protein